MVKPNLKNSNNSHCDSCLLLFSIEHPKTNFKKPGCQVVTEVLCKKKLFREYTTSVLHKRSLSIRVLVLIFKILCFLQPQGINTCPLCFFGRVWRIGYTPCNGMCYSWENHCMNTSFQEELVDLASSEGWAGGGLGSTDLLSSMVEVYWIWGKEGCWDFCYCCCFACFLPYQIPVTPG
jgi:hypothetical protein